MIWETQNLQWSLYLAATFGIRSKQVLINCAIILNYQARVVQKMDDAIHRINHYPADSVVCFVNTYPLDSNLSGG